MTSFLTFMIGAVCGGIIATVAVCMCVIGGEADGNKKGE